MDAVPIVTIDGPSGSGKGTVSREVARLAGWHLLDSGALYRLVALLGARAGLDPQDVDGHAALARSMEVEFGSDASGGERVRVGADDVTRAIRSEEAGQGASRVAAWPAVRDALLERQRAFARPPGLVADGRDMGTVIFPHARLKVFLTASAEERAMRRHKQLISKGFRAKLEDLLADLRARDARDVNRAVAPLVAATDALLLDNSGLTIEASVDRVLAWWQERSPFA